MIMFQAFMQNNNMQAAQCALCLHVRSMAGLYRSPSPVKGAAKQTSLQVRD